MSRARPADWWSYEKVKERTERLEEAIMRATCCKCGATNHDPCLVLSGPRRGLPSKSGYPHVARVGHGHQLLIEEGRHWHDEHPRGRYHAKDCKPGES